jgi:hypothetical protein
LSLFRAGSGLDELRISNRLVATRGDRLALAEGIATFRDGDSGTAEVAAITIIEVDDDGQMLRNIFFDRSAAADAFAELDACWDAQRAAGSQPNTAWETSLRQVAASDAKDWDAFVATTHPSMEYIDVRSSLWVPADDPLAMYRTMFALADWRLTRSSLPRAATSSHS